MTSFRSFPEFWLVSGGALVRIHRLANSPEHFGTSGDNRFDPPPGRRAKFGTCYLAFEPIAAYVEVFGDFEEVDEDEVDLRALSTAILKEDLRLGDVTDRSVLGDFDITAEISTGSDYAGPQALASDLFDAGFDGIRYRVRHDPAMELEAVALFRDLRQPDRMASALEWYGPQSISLALEMQGEEFRIFVQ